MPGERKNTRLTTVANVAENDWDEMFWLVLLLTQANLLLHARGLFTNLRQAWPRTVKSSASVCKCSRRKMLSTNNQRPCWRANSRTVLARRSAMAFLKYDAALSVSPI